jgi:S-adenosylmethionine hydrolase
VNPIVLMTDFGTKDGNVGVMKGVISGIFREAKIIDLSHGITPQSVLEASLILTRTYRYFPGGTVFVIVVDPGVGTKRRPLAGRIGDYYFVLPDNGILSPLLAEAEENNSPVQLIHLDKPEFWLENISYVFHGRDIFAPVGAHLVSGIKLSDLGTPIQDPVRMETPAPVSVENGLLAQVIHIDNFGNISTNVTRPYLQGHNRLELTLQDQRIKGLYRTFGELSAGNLMALLGSTDYLIISEVNGNAAQRIGAAVGDPVAITYLD